MTDAARARAEQIARAIKGSIPIYSDMTARSHTDAFTDSNAVEIIAAALDALTQELDQYKKLWELRGRALERGCPKCGYVQKSIHANDPHTIHADEGGEYHPCRCGLTHRGEYAIEDWLMHNCFHSEPLFLTKDDGLLLCVQCGQVFGLQKEA